MKTSTKKCPRCGEKCFESQARCDGCGLIFERLKFASNKKAKKCILKREKEQVIKTADFPKDLSRKKALLYCGFLGLFGAHNFYVGRYFKAITALLVTLVAVVCIALERYINYASFYENFFFLPTGIVFFMWFYDFIMLATKKYKVPIALDFEGGDVL